MARLDAGDPVTVLAGVHLGCYELFGTERVPSIRDLKDKTVSVSQLGDPGYLPMSSSGTSFQVSVAMRMREVTLAAALG